MCSSCEDRRLRSCLYHDWCKELTCVRIDTEHNSLWLQREHFSGPGIDSCASVNWATCAFFRKLAPGRIFLYILYFSTFYIHRVERYKKYFVWIYFRKYVFFHLFFRQHLFRVLESFRLSGLSAFSTALHISHTICKVWTCVRYVSVLYRVFIDNRAEQAPPPLHMCCLSQ